MAGPASVSDLTDRSLRPLTPAEATAAETLLEDAFAIIAATIPGIGARVDTDDTARALVIQVQSSMVLRVVRNPDGKLEESIDDYRWRLDSAVSTGALYLSAAERALLGTGDSSSDAFTIRPGGPVVVAPSVWDGPWGYHL